jgi:hypothetical protein
LVSRILAERFATPGQALTWAAVDRAAHGRFGPPPAPYEILTDGNLLASLLTKLLQPIRRAPVTPLPADFVVLAVDGELRDRFCRAVGKLRPELRHRTVAACFEPEVEVLLIQSKEPLEDAVGRPRCTSDAPSTVGDLKESLRRWLARFGQGRILDARTREDIAAVLDISDNSYLSAVDAWVSLVTAIRRALGECP